MNKKIKVFIILLLNIILLSPSLFAAEIRDAEVAVSENKLPKQYLVNSDKIKTYVYNDEEIYDFRDYFVIYDQGKTILKTNVIVDGYAQTIDNGGYTWDFGGFDIAKAGKYTIKIIYIGVSEREMNASVDIDIIDKDTTPPSVVGFSSINLDIGKSFKEIISYIKVNDNIDGQIELKEEFFTGHEDIDFTKPSSKPYIVTLKVKDSSNNEVSKDFEVSIVDQSAPTIYNVKNIEFKKGNKNNIQYKNHLKIEDNYYSLNDIEIKYQLVSSLEEDQKVLMEDAVIDVNKPGEYYIKVVTQDKSGNTSNASYKVIITNSINLLSIVLFMNLGLLVIVGIIILVYYLNKKNKGVKNNEKN